MKQITITVPDNCELKQDGNTYTVVERKKKLTYEDVARELFLKQCFYIRTDGQIECVDGLPSACVMDLTNCTSEKQAKKLLAINKLMNVAKYLNGDWQPDWDNVEHKYCIFYSNQHKTLEIDSYCSVQYGVICFKSKELAQQAIEILGEETIKLALCTDY